LDNGANANTAPLLFVPAKEDRSRWAKLEVDLTNKKQAIEDRKGEAREAFEKWLADEGSSLATTSDDSDPDLFLKLTEPSGPRRGKAGSDSVEWPGEDERHPGPFGPAPLINAGLAVENAAPTFTRTGLASYGAFIYIESKPNGAVLSRMNKAGGFRGWDLFLSEGRPTVHVVDQWPDQALKITAKAALKPGRWHHLLAVFDGSLKGADAISLYVNGRKAEVEVNNNNLGSNIVATVPLRLGGRSDGTNATDTLSNGKVFLQDLRFYNRALSPVQIARLAGAGLVRDFLAGAPDQRSAEQTNLIYDLYLGGFDGPAQKLQGELAQLKAEESQFRARGATTLIMEEKKESEAVAHVLVRGNYAAKGEEVKASTPQALPPMQPEMPHNRLGLAYWILSQENPLTARVTVNRLWSQLFGIGIVETTELPDRLADGTSNYQISLTEKGRQTGCSTAGLKFWHAE